VRAQTQLSRNFTHHSGSVQATLTRGIRLKLAAGTAVAQGGCEKAAGGISATHAEREALRGFGSMSKSTAIVTLVDVAGLASGPSVALAQRAVAPTAPAASTTAAPPSAGDATDRGNGDVLTLASVVDDALEHNPDVAAMAREFDASRAKIPQAKAWPEPMVEVGWMGDVVPFDVQNGDPSSGRTVSVTQEIMWPGKLSLMGKMAGADADATWWAFEQTRRAVIADVKTAYFDLAYLTRAVDTVTKNKALMERVAKIAEARYAVGKGVQQDVLKAQLEVTRMTAMLAMYEQRRQSTAARLNTLLYRDPGSPLPPLEELRPRDFTYTVEALEEMAFASPVLKQQRTKVDREQYAIRLAEKQYYPDLSVGYTYVNRPGLPEMHGVTVGVKLPLYFWQRQRPAVAEAAAAMAAERKRLEGAQALLFFKIKDAYLMATTAQRLATLYGSAMVPQATLTLESGIAAYESGGVDFLMLLDDLKTLFDAELGYYEQLADFEKAVAALEPLVGAPLR
jgi:outer membrane protein TolC